MADRGRVIGNVTRKLLFPSGSLPVRTYQFSTYQLQFLSNFILLAIDVFDFLPPEFSVTFSSLDLPLNTLFSTSPIRDFVNFLRSIEKKSCEYAGIRESIPTLVDTFYEYITCLLPTIFIFHCT